MSMSDTEQRPRAQAAERGWGSSQTKTSSSRAAGHSESGTGEALGAPQGPSWDGGVCPLHPVSPNEGKGPQNTVTEIETSRRVSLCLPGVKAILGSCINQWVLIALPRREPEPPGGEKRPMVPWVTHPEQVRGGLLHPVLWLGDPEEGKVQWGRGVDTGMVKGTGRDTEAVLGVRTVLSSPGWRSARHKPTQTKHLYLRATVTTDIKAQIFTDCFSHQFFSF